MKALILATLALGIIGNAADAQANGPGCILRSNLPKDSLRFLGREWAGYTSDNYYDAYEWNAGGGLKCRLHTANYDRRAQRPCGFAYNPLTICRNQNNGIAIRGRKVNGVSVGQ